MKRLLLMTFISFILINLSAYDLNLWSETAIMIDFETEQILYAKNKDLKIQPASMTKLLTIFMAYEAISNGLTTKETLVEISPNADFKNLPRDSSLMFIEQGQKVTLFELMIGLAIPSGNDAAIAIAEHLYGSVDNYLIELNKVVNSLGLSELTFVDSSGYNDNNSITVSQFVEFCLIFIKKYPESLNELFSLESFIYPKQRNGSTSIGGIKQYNHNPLIGIYPNSDGLKTGFINASGMNISLTAFNEDRRVIAVLAGVKDQDRKTAESKRTYDSITILNYGLNYFKNIHLDKIELPPINITKNLYIIPEIPYRKNFTHFINSEIIYELKTDLSLPIKEGQKLGYVTLNQNGIKFKYPIISTCEIISND